MIAFTKVVNSYYSQIFVINADGTDLAQLTTGFYFDQFSSNYVPEWSPDGSKIVFITDRHINHTGNNSEIYVMDADGSNQTRLTQNLENEGSPTWSPDGSQIAFIRDNEIHLMDPDGSNMTALGIGASDYSWSPDGSRIVFSHVHPDAVPDVSHNLHCCYGSHALEISVVNVDGTDQERLTDNAYWDRWPSWSPDGERIVYSYEYDGGMDIYVMDADGKNKIHLMDDLFHDITPIWSPDGLNIAFQAGRLEEGIYIMNADGSGQTLLAEFGQSPSWTD